MSLSGISKTWNLRPETLARLTTPAMLVLVILIAYELAQLTWLLIVPVSLPDFVRPSDSAKASPSTTVERDYEEIAGWHLFGEVNTQVAAPEPVVKAPETRLNASPCGC